MWLRSFRSLSYAPWSSLHSFLSSIAAEPRPSSLCCPRPSSRHLFNLTLVCLALALHLLPPSTQNPLSIPARLCTSLFLTLSIRVTPNIFLKHFRKILSDIFFSAVSATSSWRWMRISLHTNKQRLQMGGQEQLSPPTGPSTLGTSRP